MRRIAWPFALMFVGCPKHATPARYEVPVGFSGSFTLEYGVTDAPPLPMDGRRQVVRFDSRGHMATSTAQTFGEVDAQFVRQDAAHTALRFVPCAGVTCKLAAGEATLLGTGTTEAGGVKRQVEFGAIGPCEVGFDLPPLPARKP
jgi:hypothetical protein